MERHFDTSLRELKEQLVAMAVLVQRAIELSIQALQERDRSKTLQVYEIEKRINAAHVAVDGACLKLLATQQPAAVDLRLIVAVMRINTDLERMGDQAVNISNNAEHYLRADAIKPLVDLPVMSAEASLMVREAIDSFLHSNATLAREVLLRDDRVDSLKNRIFKDVMDLIKANPRLLDSGINLILIARNLERIGDHATNIAEDVIFAITGDDVRHSPRGEAIRSAWGAGTA